jgi:outer membrane PBP1 activator LpoA protein
VRTAPAPAMAAIQPATASTAAATPRNDAIALVLPLESPAYGRAADAVKAGFMSAAERAGASGRVRIIGHGDDGVIPAFAAAEQSGVALVVGPLTRDDLKTVLAVAPARPRMLALNLPDDLAQLPGDTYALTLGVDGDATLLARVARADGAHTVALVSSAAPLQKRFAAAFAAEWRRNGGAAPREYRFDANPEALTLLRRELGARPPDAVVLAVDAEDASLAKSFLPPGPVFAVSQIADGLPATMLRDLEGVRYVEVPWLADPDSPSLARMPHANLDSPVLERLYALGLDAFAVAQMLAEAVPPTRLELEGATGRIVLTTTRVFERQGRVVVIREGRIQLLPSAQ